MQQTLAISGTNWRQRKRRRAAVRATLAYVITTVIALLFASPFIWMLSMSLQSPRQLTTYPPTWIPAPVQWHNYADAMAHPMRPFGTYIKNSLLYTGIATTGLTLSSAFIAYGFSRLNFKGRDVCFMLLLSTMMLPAEVTLIPKYILFYKIHLIDSLLPLLIPAFFGSAFDIFLLRQFFLTIPRELDEAAILDGCDHFSIFWRIIMPLAKPAVVTVIMFSIVATWNDFMGPLIYVNSTHKLTAAVGLHLFKSMAGDTGGFVHFGQVMAAAVVTLLPMIALFMMAQRYFIAGIAMTGLREG